MGNDFLEKKANQVRLDVLTSIFKAGYGRSGSCMSVIEILIALYYGHLFNKKVFNFNPLNPKDPEQDYLVLSKAHAVPVQYAILADLGFFDKSELGFLSKLRSMLQSSPNSKVPGITSSIFSHGQGLSVALGIALSLQMERKRNKVFTILGDGELQEGQIWEAAMAASHYKLNNLIAFVDNNKVQADGNIDSVIKVSSIQDKFEAFGWKVLQVTDGHDFDKLLFAVERAFTSPRSPVCIWCHTVVGKGVPFAEGKHFYKNTVLSEDEILELKKGIDFELEHSFIQKNQNSSNLF